MEVPDRHRSSDKTFHPTTRSSDDDEWNIFEGIPYLASPPEYTESGTMSRIVSIVGSPAHSNTVRVYLVTCQECLLQRMKEKGATRRKETCLGVHVHCMGQAHSCWISEAARRSEFRRQWVLHNAVRDGKSLKSSALMRLQP